MKGQKLAMGLAWFSLGLGLYELLTPGHLSRVLGLEGREGLLRFYGLREIGAGLGIFLTQPNPAPWVWGRVGGDALDLATLGAALKPDNPKRGNAALALGSVVGITVLDLLCGQQLSADTAA